MKNFKILETFKEILEIFFINFVEFCVKFVGILTDISRKITQNQNNHFCIVELFVTETNYLFLSVQAEKEIGLNNFALYEVAINVAGVSNKKKLINSYYESNVSVWIFKSGFK